jgi:hypothetical protein
MPVHDWTRVSDGAFHDFHMSWLLEIKRAPLSIVASCLPRSP